jgi:hypothetical protein
MINNKSPSDNERADLNHQTEYDMNYNDELCNRPEKISENLRIRIRSIVMDPRRKSDWNDVTDEIVSRFYPNLSKLEKLVCRAIIQAGWDLNGNHCPCEHIELRLHKEYISIFKSKYRIKNTILVLCSKGVVKWMTKLTFDRYSELDRYRNGKTFRITQCETYSINPETVQDIGTEALGEICRLSTENMYEGYIAIKYKQYLITHKLHPPFYPMLN